MNLKDIDLVRVTKLISQQIDHITCLQCCKYYIAPETAACGHTLCHSCWCGRQTCPSCAKPVERRHLIHNHPIQNLTEHIHTLGESFEKLFNIKFDEFMSNVDKVESENDLTKNVKDWLANSQNHFSAPAQSSEQSSQEPQQHQHNPLIVSCNKIQIHTNITKSKSPEKVVHVPLPQDDWDKIEPMPDTDDIRKDKENIVGPMDIEPFYIDDNEYTVSNPRRSSRKRELKPTGMNYKMNEYNSLEQQSSKDSCGEIDKKSNKTKQNWNNVKRMRKEFSKLGKKNRTKLNVSIEMCKKAQSTSKTNVLPQASPPQVYDIDENTPYNLNIERQNKEVLSKGRIDMEYINTKANTPSITKTNVGINDKNQICTATAGTSKLDVLNKQTDIQANNSQETNAETIHSSKHEETNSLCAKEKAIKMPFYKRSALYPNRNEINTIKTMNHNIDSNAIANDDIEITIKVGNTITNIFIKKKNDVELKINTDREIQTSLGPHNINEKSTSSQNAKTQNIVINVGDDHKVDVEHKSKTNPKIEDSKQVSADVKTISGKKNTDSADTATAQFEITESVEKKLSKVMEHAKIDVPIKSKNTSIDENKTSLKNKSQQKISNPDDLEYFNDLDIFESESVKESDVQVLKNTEHASSEILLCTVKTRNKTQKHTEKRERERNDEDTLPKSKKIKLLNKKKALLNETMEPCKSKLNQPESEPMNYDAIIGTVFANIDADIEEFRQSQHIIKNTHIANDNIEESEHENHKKTQNVKGKRTQEVATPRTNEINTSKQSVNENCNQKDSENVFSVTVEKEDEKTDVAPTNEKVPLIVPSTNIEEYLTPVLCRNLESTSEALVVEIVDDDSDKSVVEETPQKSTSLSKTKQKGNGSNKNKNQTQNIKLTEQRELSKRKTLESANPKSIISITETSTEMKSSNNVTAIEVADTKRLETPLTINKFCNQIQHKSTPYARKSLNFNSDNVDIPDPELTLCPTSDAIAKTTQEKEFMNKAFEKTPPAVRPLTPRNQELRSKKRIAGSCLTVGEIAKLKLLCAQHKWIYEDKYCKDLTHLVVGVDDENKSQRSVKYMCALASSKWIISYKWVEQCLQSKDVVSEEYFVALDSTGEPGPLRSRIATKKLFEGITFFCMEPFSVLDVDTLKGMLEAAGGRVVSEAKEVKVNDNTTAPAILLAEPENTQEDRFIYLALELSIVPVNYEWVLNCLGSYTLGSIQELLLCPASLLPKATEKWPQELVARDED